VGPKFVPWANDCVAAMSPTAMAASNKGVFIMCLLLGLHKGNLCGKRSGLCEASYTSDFSSRRERHPVKTDRGEFILDNQAEDILSWFETGYSFVKRQSQTNPNVWVSLGTGRSAPAARRRNWRRSSNRPRNGAASALITWPGAESEAMRPPIPTESGHPIRSKAATDSEAMRPPC
jgi:Bacterial transglutaminase-like cysteine proteinase BTLCP